MGLSEQIRTDLTSAMKERATTKVATLRLIQAALQNERIALGHELSDEEVQTVIRRAAKQRRDSIDQYEKASREDLAAREREELALVEAYLPTMMSEAETEKAVAAAIAETGASSKKDLGAVMGKLMAKHKGSIDGKLAQRIAARTLQ
jgi:uncharacterized protein YqeY